MNESDASNRPNDILLDGINPICISIYPDFDKETFILIDQVEATEFGESPYQLQEGCGYEYGISSGFNLREIPGVIMNSKHGGSHGGRITPGNFTGTIPVEIIDEIGTTIRKFSFEVRSIKSTYRQDYRVMLEDIAEKCTDLLMQHSSPAVQSYEPKPLEDPRTLYQRFSFVKSIVDSDEFSEAIQRILAAPVTRWLEAEKSKSIRNLGKVDNAVIRQIASGNNRIPLPEKHPLKRVLNTIPDRVTVISKIDTTDNVENQFVKHVLTEFSGFCSEVRDKFTIGTREYLEARHLEEILNNYLDHPLFKGMTKPFTLPLNNPVLQRKEGYREILRVWLLFDLAAKLIWHGGDEVYQAGKRDVAKLYEYWLFFKLLDLLGTIFKIEPAELEKLIVETNDGLGLTLKSGTYFPLEGVYDNGKRKLNIKFSYNRTFSGGQEYPKAGSWMQNMRPDYTLTIWPFGFSESDAEIQELIVHLHFDAKYKIDKLDEIFGVGTISNDDDEAETGKQKKAGYKREDILKMHAYKDAIRRTAGAYVLYPGEKSENREGFHEIIPGLGAFTVRPSKTDDGTKELRTFIEEVVNHFINRATQHERVSYHIYDVYKGKPGHAIRESIPEEFGGVRVFPPEETSVIVGFCTDEQYKWIVRNKLYNFRMNTRRGSLRLNPLVAGASYILVHRQGSNITNDLWRITKDGPRVFSAEEMNNLGYYHVTTAFLSCI